VPEGAEGSLTLDAGYPSWKFGNSPATFSLNAGATAKITLKPKGHLLTFQNDFDNTQPAENFDGKPGEIYVVTR